MSAMVVTMPIATVPVATGVTADAWSALDKAADAGSASTAECCATAATGTVKCHTAPTDRATASAATHCAADTAVTTATTMCSIGGWGRETEGQDGRRSKAHQFIHVYLAS